MNVNKDPKNRDEHSEVERIKALSNHLRGGIAHELINAEPGFSRESTQLLKFHGVYTQDNRDTRSARVRSGLGVEHICMIRVAIPGGRLSADQYLSLNDLATRLGHNSLRCTTRQGIQFHFVTKSELAPLVREINDTLLTSWGGCGDVVRNVTSCPSDRYRSLGLAELTDAISLRYKAPSDAYYELWVDGERVPQEILAAPSIDESIYGATMLPRKFKIGVTTSVDNCIDVLSCDLGVVLDIDQADRVRLYVGGGLGRSGTDESTFAQLGLLLGEIDRSDLFEAIDGVIEIQRDHGNRRDRSHARLKYLINDWGLDRFRSELLRRHPIEIRPAYLDTFVKTTDHLGTASVARDLVEYGLKLPSGRIADTDTTPYRTALASVIGGLQAKIAITARGDLLFLELNPERVTELEQLLEESGLSAPLQLSAVRRNAFACVALPTCGQALAESERFLPSLLTELEASLSEFGLDDLDLDLRMTGCPNGCARPYLGEVGIVGRSKKSYDIFVGADRQGRRLNKLFGEDIRNDRLVETLQPLFQYFERHRLSGQRFGDFIASLNDETFASLQPVTRRTVHRTTQDQV
ncbi:MAG: NADPH-dependent assimilatory sulfite reductase hemoprotein subunit [Acidimicrobiales bacterium]